MPVNLILFDCDGTLVDSQGFIVACFRQAFAANGLPPPRAAAARETIGLSLDHAMGRLLSSDQQAMVPHLVQSYFAAFDQIRQDGPFEENLFEGTLSLLEQLSSRSIDMGVVTGKGRHGLDAVLQHHRLERYFSSLQTADRHPSKPHPSMVLTAMNELGHTAEETIVIGDTLFDIEMAHAAGCAAVGVDWGYHDPKALRDAGAKAVLSRFDELLTLLD